MEGEEVGEMVGESAAEYSSPAPAAAAPAPVVSEPSTPTASSDATEEVDKW